MKLFEILEKGSIGAHVLPACGDVVGREIPFRDYYIETTEDSWSAILGKEF